jgi:hypothetical protein
MAGEPPKSVRWNPVSTGKNIPVESEGKLAETYVANFAGPVLPGIVYEYDEKSKEWKFKFPTGVRRKAYTHTRYPPKEKQRPIRSAENAEAARNRAIELAEDEALDQYHDRGRHSINSANFNLVNANLENVEVAPHVPDNREATHLSDRTDIGNASKYLPLTSVGGYRRTRRQKRKRQRARQSKRRRQ